MRAYNIMKTRWYLLLLAIPFFVASCSKDDNTVSSSNDYCYIKSVTLGTVKRKVGTISSSFPGSYYAMTINLRDNTIENRDSLKASMEALKAEHHHHHDEDECDDPECECHHHHDDDDDEDEHEHHHHHHHHHGHDADEIFASWGFETMHKFTEDELKEKIAALDDEAKFGAVLRAKGVLPAADGEQWIHFDHVPGEVEIRRGPAGVIGRLCVIGSKINEDALKALFGE